jgi:hypothetical protein
MLNPDGRVQHDWYDWFRSLTALTRGQLAFPATQLPSLDPNTLDDYEEGTWTPLATFATPGDTAFGGHILGSPHGNYTKIGNLVYYTFNYSVSPFTHSTASGHLRVTGLPFLNAARFQVGTCSHEGINMALVPGQNQTQVVCMRKDIGDDFFMFSVSGPQNSFINEVIAANVNSGGNLVLFCSGCFIAQ